MLELLQFKNVSYGYEGRPDAVRNLTFNVERGEWVALMGANGCGKSTVARLACGLLQPVEGVVRAPRVGFVAQDPEANIVGDTVIDDVAYGIGSRIESRERLERVESCLELVGLSGSGQRSMQSLSGGELQRAAVAAALAADVELLVLDEPTSHLPRPDGLAFAQTMQRAAARRSFGLLYITHHPEEARFADRVIVLARGRIALEGRPEQVLFRRELLGSLGVRPDLRLCVERVLAMRGCLDSGPSGNGYERLVERICSALNV